MSLYIDQKPVVSSKTDNPANGIIRVTFADVTLSLSLTDASWLAENIQREIRKVEHEHALVRRLTLRRPCSTKRLRLPEDA